MKRLSLVLVAVGLLAVPALAGLSGTVNADYGMSAHSPGNIHAKIYGANLHGVNVYTWESSFNVQSATGDGLLLGNPFTGFCIDLLDRIGPGNYNWDVVDLDLAPDGPHTMGWSKADRIRELWGRHHADVTDSAKAASFQIAVWEIVYQNNVADAASYDVRSGYNGPADGFKVVSSRHINYGVLTATANSWLHSLNGNGPMAMLGALTAENTQDFVVPVPAPGAAVLGACGLGLVGWIKRRFS